MPKKNGRENRPPDPVNLEDVVSALGDINNVLWQLLNRVEVIVRQLGASKDAITNYTKPSVEE